MKNLLRLLVVTLCSLVFVALVPIGSAGALVVESIVYKDGDAKLYRISPDGTGKAQLLAVLGSQPARAVPSRDGTRLLAVPSSTQMLHYKTDGSEPTNIAVSGYQYSTTFFAFSPSGTQVTFSGKATGDLRNNIYVQNADGTGTPFKVTSGSTNLAVADWGSGGILYRGGGGTVTGATPLWLVPPVANSTGTIITPTNFNALDARFSPDGTRIAMAGQNINATTGAGEGYGLFMVNPNGSAFGRLVALPNDVRPNSVAWSPDGTRVAVTAVTTADAIYRIYIVDVATGNTTLVTTGSGATPPNYIYWGPVEDPALPTVISTVDVIGQYSDKVTLTATLRYQATGLPVVGKTIHFKVNGVDFATTGTTDGTGTAGVSYPVDFQSGFYSIEAYFTGDATTSPASTAPGNNRTLTVNREGAALTYTGPTTTAGGTLALSATLVETPDVTPGDLTQAGNVQFTVRTVAGNTLVGTYTVPVPANGIVSATTGVLANEPHTVDVSLLSNLYYSASSVNLIVKATPTLAGNSVNGQYGDTVALKATMTPAVSGLPVRFSIGGTTLGTVATDASGVAILNYPIGVAEGNHTVDLTFTANTNYVGATATGSLSVAKRPVTLSYTGDTVAVGGAFQLKAAVTPTSPGNIALAGPVTFTVTQGATSTTHTAPVDAAGVAVLNLATLPANTYTVAVSINSPYYEATPATATVRAGTVMTVDDLPATYGDTVTLRARLTMGGAGLGGQTVTFKLGSTDLGPALTDGSGYATVTYPVTVGAGPHTITVEFPDGGAYAGSDDTGTLTVSRATGVLSYSGDLVATGGSFNLEGTLAVTQGTVTNAGSLQFVVKQGAGTIGTYTDAVDAAGVAQTTISTLPVGAYTVTLSLPLNPYYTADPINVIIRSGTTLTVPLVNATYGGTANVAAILKAGAVGVSGEPIDFTVNSVDAGTVNTVASGTASVAYPVTLPAGDYTIYAEYDGDAMYGPSNNTGTLRVAQAPATLSYAGDDIATGGAFALNGHLTPSQGALPPANTMQMKFDFMQGASVMHTYTLNIDGAGNAVGAAAPPPVAGAYTLKVSLLNNNYYTATPIDVPVRAGTTLTVGTPVDGTYGGTVTISATLKSGAVNVSGKPVVFNVNGVNLAPVNTVAGVASVNYAVNLAAPGPYNITATYAGDTTYGPSNGSGVLNVAKATATLSYAGHTVATGGAFVLNGHLAPSQGAIAGGLQMKFDFKQGATVMHSYTVPINGSGDAIQTPAAPPAVGGYTLTVSLVTNNYFTADPIDIPIKAGTTLTVVTPVNAVYGDTKTLSATLKSGAAFLDGETVVFNVNGVDLTPVTTVAGVATSNYTVSLPAPGPYMITATFAATSAYGGSTGSGVLNVAKATGTLSYSGDVVATGGAFQLKGHFTPDQGTLQAGMQMQFQFKQGVTVTGTYTANIDPLTGDAVVTPSPNIALGGYELTVSLVTNNYYTAAPVPVAIRGASTLTWTTPFNTTYGGTATITATLKSGTNGLNALPIIFTINGVDQAPVNTVATGVATLNYPVSLAAGQYDIAARFEGDPYYAPSDTTGKLNVAQAPATLSYAGDDIATGGAFALNGHLTPSQGALPPANTMQMKFDFMQGATVMHTYTLNIDGAGNAVGAAAPPPVAGAYTLKVSLLNNNYYTATPIDVPVRAGTTLTVNTPVDGTYGGTVTISATLKSGAANVSGKPVVFNVNGVNLAPVNTVAGVASVNYAVNLAAPGPYNITATYAGDTTYGPSNGGGVLNVAKATATLSYAGDTVATGGAFTLNGHLAPSQGAIAGGLQMKFDFKQGATVMHSYTVPINGSGDAIQTPAAPPAVGGYTLTVSLVTNNYFTADPIDIPIKAGTTLTVVTPVNAVYGDTKTLSATLKSGAAFLDGETVVFNVNGVDLTPVTTVAGVATSNYAVSLPAPGPYMITATFAATSAYGGSTGSGVLNVAPAPTNMEVSVSPTTVTYGGAITLNATLTANGNPLGSRPVVFEVNGTSLPALNTNGSGQVSTTYTVNLPGPGPYTVKAIYGGDASFYDSSEASTTFNVTPATGTLSYSGDTVSYGGAFNVTGTLSVTQGALPAAGTMQMKFDFMQGATVAHSVTVPINGAGVASGSTALPHGTYQLNISLVPNGYYTATAISRSILASTTLTVGDVTGRVTEVVTLTATLKAGATNLDGQTVNFSVNGTPVGSAPTVGGVATLSWQVNLPVRATPYTIGASFATNSPYYQSTGNGNLTVVKSTPTISATAPAVAYSDYWSNVTATVTSFNGSLLSGIPVTLWVNTGTGAAQVGGIVYTDVNGQATLPWNQRNTWAFNSATPTVEVRFAGNTDYNAATSGVITPAKALETGAFFNVNGVNPGNSNNYKVNFSWQDEADGSRGNPSGGTITVQLWADHPTNGWTLCSSASYTPSATPTALVNNQQMTCNIGVDLAGRGARLMVSASVYYTTPIWTGNFANADGPMSVASVTTVSGGSTTLTATVSNGVAGNVQTRSVLLAGLTSDVTAPMTTLRSSLLAAAGGNGKSGKPPVAPGLEGQPIYFSINGQFVGMAPIGPDGSAYLDYKADLPAGTYTISAEFRGNTTHGPASGTGTLTVTARGATLTYMGELTAPAGPLNLGALVTDPNGGYDVAKAGSVRFTVTDKVTGTQVGTYEAPIHADGTAHFVTEALPAGTYEVTVALTDERFYTAPPASAEVTIVEAEVQTIPEQ